MLNPKDLYTFRVTVPLEQTGDSPIGTTIISYEIRRYRDVRNLGEALAYQVLCTQRIIIPNATPLLPGSADPTSFSDYPAAITNQIQITPAGAPPELIDYSPRTINSSVATSFSSSSGASGSATHQHTSGSSTSQSNSFGASASLGFFGDLGTGSLSVDYDHTWGSGRSRSASAGTETGSSRQSASSDSMSVKDWACYAYLDAGDSSPTWVWGQEYPWDVIRYGYNTGALPQFVQGLLYDGTILLPPSQLSLFGVDFTMSSAWIIKLEPGESSIITFDHTINYYTATHSVSGNGSTATITATLDSPTQFSYPPTLSPPPTPPSIDLCTYGLDPILNDAANAAVIGFVPRRFLASPVPADASGSTPAPFKIISSSNNLLIQDTTSYSGLALTSVDQGAGFTPSPRALTATLTPNCQSLEMTMSFKVIDTVTSYKLFMKHWKTDSTGVVLTIVINSDTANPIVKYVDDLEAEGGETNLMSISLRNLDYGSVDYHDFLQLGLNTIQITLQPINPVVSGTTGYQLRAVSIERE